jgi:hypothetical protein
LLEHIAAVNADRIPFQSSESQMTAQLNALKTFYATLSPEQQKIFNAETGPGQARTRRNNR